MKKPLHRPYGPLYFSNWVDMFMPAMAYRILPYAAKIPGITPNIITLFSFSAYTLASFLLFVEFPYHLIVAAILIIVSYIADCLDGQLSRSKNMQSELGNYLDKTLDVLKIYILTISLSFAVYQQTHSILSIILGFTACFFFNFRYYIKHEVIFAQMDSDKEYLTKAKAKRQELVDNFDNEYASLSKTLKGQIKKLWLINRKIFWVDEGEFVFFTAIAALFNQLPLLLTIFAVSQSVIGIFRLMERAYLIVFEPKQLLKPLRK